MSAHPRTPVARRRGRVVALALVLVCLAVGCTPDQYQRWWVSRGHAPLAEPELSAKAAAATAYWAEVARRNRFAYQVSGIDPPLAARMAPSWRPGCPVPLSSLRYVRVSYVGFDGAEHVGELVLHADAVIPAVVVLQAMWDARFPIERMQLVDDYGASDEASMAANNTSAFNCRAVTGGTGWSQHAYGRAIDVNPIQNPYFAGGPVQPAAGVAFLDRSAVRPGMIVLGDAVTRALRSVGWGWGGLWSSLKDYMHISSTGS